MTFSDTIRTGLTVLDKYCRDCEVRADHEVIWAGPYEMALNEYDSLDVYKLQQAGWHYDAEVQRWSVAL